MAHLFFGTLKPEHLQRNGFTRVQRNNISLKECLSEASHYNDRFPTPDRVRHIAFLPRDRELYTQNGFDIPGKCIWGGTEPYKPTDYAGNIPGVYRLYTPRRNIILDIENIRRDSIREVRHYFDRLTSNKPPPGRSSKSLINKSLINKFNSRMRALQGSLWGDRGDFDYSSINSRNTNINSGNTNINSRNTNSNEREEMERRHREQLSQAENNKRKQREEIERLRREQLAQYQNLLNNIRLYHKSEKQNLSNKNRLIAETSSNIQTSTDKLEELNNKINEANQEIAKNNVDFEKKII